MQLFDSAAEAFQWFFDNIYPDLSAEERRKLKDAKHDFESKRKGVSEKRMMRIMSEFGEVKCHVSFTKKEN